MNQMGYATGNIAAKPVIAIINTWSISTSATRISSSASDVNAAYCRPAAFRRTAGDLAVGEQGQTDDHALPEFSGDGDGRADPLRIPPTAWC